MATVLVRYCEIGLKSTPVRRRFETQLRENILSMFVRDHVEALMTFGDARIFFETDEPDKCISSLRRVFGVASVSLVVPCTSDLEDVCRTAAEFSRGKISEGQTLAVRARREGTHPYTSQMVGREAGSAIFNENKHLGISVNLNTPDKTFYIEIRNNKGYVFDEYIACPGGLPMGTQGRVLARVDGDRGVLSAWMMMKRGCRVWVDSDDETLNLYDPALRVIGPEDEELLHNKEILGHVMGMSISQFDASALIGRLPTFTPTIGMTDAEVDDMLMRVKTSTF